MNIKKESQNNLEYYKIKNTLKYPSISKILKETSEEPDGIKEWRKRVGEKEADRIIKFSMKRGTYMHDLSEIYLDTLFNTNVENPLQYTYDTINKKYIKEYESGLISQDEIDVGLNLFNLYVNNDFYGNIKEIICQEDYVWTGRNGGYVGRLDLMIKNKQDKLAIVDNKSSKKPKKDEWLENYKLQLSAYSIAYYDRHKVFPHFNELWIACESGEMQFVQLKRDEIKYWGEEFLKRVKLFHEKNKQK